MDFTLCVALGCRPLWAAGQARESFKKVSKLAKNRLTCSLGGPLWASWGQVAPRAAKSEKRGSGQRIPHPCWRSFSDGRATFWRSFFECFLESFLAVFFEILVSKGIPNGGLWGVIWSLFRDSLNMWKSHAGSLIFKVSGGGQFGRFFHVFLRGAFQEASGGVFF